MTGGFKLAYSVSDALVLQCYESEDMAAFGHELTEEQWRAICRVKEVHERSALRHAQCCRQPGLSVSESHP
jgi:hypothetical protein